MSQQNVHSLEKAQFARKLAGLAASGEISDAAFADAVYTAMSAHGINEDLFRDAFGLTKGATDRWTQRQNLPQPTIRAKILIWISEKL